MAMYCSTCELEIKGDDKDTCPVCGAPLFDSHDEDSALINQDQAEPLLPYRKLLRTSTA